LGAARRDEESQKKPNHGGGIGDEKEKERGVGYFQGQSTGGKKKMFSFTREGSTDGQAYQRGIRTS